ncbi:MAG: peptidoglycan bridge formation glycyltransferase FemA/FemB family protein, partial [Marmoricola sp.]
MPSSSPPASLGASLRVRTITAAEHLAFLEKQRSASFLQTPAWAEVKPEWRPESIGWERAGEPGSDLVGAALVLYRQLPRIQRYLAYLPEGPLIDWDAGELAVWLAPMADHLKAKGAFGIRIGPPVVTRRWSAQQVKDGIADDAVRSLTELPPTERSAAGTRTISQLRDLGWQAQSVGGGFAAGQPQYNFQIPLRVSTSTTGDVGEARTEEGVLKAMNQLWRRNIKKAAKAGVVVTSTTMDGAASGILDPVETFHALYVETAERDHFTPRPLAYFRTMVHALGAEDPDRIRLYFAHHEGDLVASTIWIRVGTHTWYSYGASTTHKREVRGSNAIQWQMI